MILTWQNPKIHPHHLAGETAFNVFYGSVKKTQWPWACGASMPAEKSACVMVVAKGQTRLFRHQRGMPNFCWQHAGNIARDN